MMWCVKLPILVLWHHLANTTDNGCPCLLVAVVSFMLYRFLTSCCYQPLSSVGCGRECIQVSLLMYPERQVGLWNLISACCQPTTAVTGKLWPHLMLPDAVHCIIHTPSLRGVTIIKIVGRPIVLDIIKDIYICIHGNKTLDTKPY